MKQTFLQETLTPIKISVGEFHPTIKKTNYLRMKTSNQILLFGCILLLSSCRVVFENPQPLHAKEIHAMPAELIGTYIEEDSDTLIISQRSYLLKDRGPFSDKNNHGTLNSGRDVLKKFRKYYVLSKLVNDSIDDNAPKMWFVFLLKLEGKELLVSQVEDGQSKKDTFDVTLLKKYTPVKVIDEGETDSEAYLINPTQKQFKLLIKNDLFKPVYRFRRID
ncbi:MAG: hypothetical protein JNK09_08050 [Prolixibacteraceae bacterium]|nr:hypothetical protein [Prolixibacteraceae bacterium]